MDTDFAEDDRFILRKTYPIPDQDDADLMRRCRQALNLSTGELSEQLALGPNGDRTIRRWEKGEKDIPGPAWVAISFMLQAIDQTDLVKEIYGV